MSNFIYELERELITIEEQIIDKMKNIESIKEKMHARQKEYNNEIEAFLRQIIHSEIKIDNLKSKKEMLENKIAEFRKVDEDKKTAENKSDKYGN